MRPVTQSNMVKSQPKTSNTSTIYLTHKINKIRPPHCSKSTNTQTQLTKTSTKPFQPNPTPQRCTTRAKSCGNSKNRATQKNSCPVIRIHSPEQPNHSNYPTNCPQQDPAEQLHGTTSCTCNHRQEPVQNGRSQTKRQQTDGIKELQQPHRIDIDLQPPAGTNTEQTIATRQQTDGSTTADIDRAGQASNQQYATTGILMDLQPPADNPQ